MPPGCPSSPSGARRCRRSGGPSWACRAWPLPLRAEGEASLVELLQHLVERLLAEVRDGQQVVRGLLHELAHGVDLGPAQAVAGTLGEVEVLDGQIEVGRAATQRAHLAQLQSPGSVA